MFEMSPSGTNAETLPPLIDGVVNDVLLRVGPDSDQTPLQLLHVVYSRPIQALLHHSPDLVVHWVRSGLFGVQRSGEMNAGVARSRRRIVSRALCAGALSC